MPINILRKIDGKYKIHEEIGTGSHAVVHRVTDPKGNSFAAKFENAKHFTESTSSEDTEANPPRIRVAYLEHEYLMMQTLYEVRQGAVRTPKVIEYLRHGDYHVMIMELLGDSLLTWWIRGGRKFSIKTKLMIMKQALLRIHYAHQCGIVHRNVKLDNFLIGRHWHQRHTMYLIDFGLSYAWGGPQEYAAFDGAKLFCSINSALDLTLSRCDDIESLLYMMAFLERSTLPWSQASSFNELAIMKRDIKNEDLFRGMPGAFAAIRDDIKKLGYEGEPRYGMYGAWIDKELTRRGYQDDGQYDWMQSAGEGAGASES